MSIKKTELTTPLLRILFSISVVTLFLASCSKDPIREKPVDPGPDPVDSLDLKTGCLIINEGNFNWGNATVTYINPEFDYVQPDLFTAVNNRPLGDVAQSMGVYNDLGFIIVNNSNKIEVVSMNTFESVKTISGFNSPRFIEFIDATKAYVTNMKKDISIVNLKTLEITGTIQTPEWTEGLIRYNDYIFATCIGVFNEPSIHRKAKVLIISTKEDKIIDSIQTGKEPVNIVIDKKNKMWVLSTGGWDSYEPASLVRIDPDLKIVEKAYVFPSQSAVPSRLCINPTGDTLYYLKDGVYQLPVTASALPVSPLIKSEGRLLYGLNIHPDDGTIWVTDAVDYVQPGRVYHYDTKGTLVDSFKTGTIPGNVCFGAETE